MDGLEGLEIFEISHKEKDKPVMWNLENKSITETDPQIQRTK